MNIQVLISFSLRLLTLILFIVFYYIEIGYYLRPGIQEIYQQLQQKAISPDLSQLLWVPIIWYLLTSILIVLIVSLVKPVKLYEEVGLITGLITGIVGGLVMGLVVGLVLGLAVGLFGGWMNGFVVVVFFTLFMGLGAGFIIGLVAGLTNEFSDFV